jgi:HEAT repeat protein
MRAVEAISRIGSEQESADRMFQLLEHDNDAVRTTASQQLGFLGARTSDLDLRDFIVSNLINRLHDTIAPMAAKSLFYIGTTEAISAHKQWQRSRKQ